jgi:hypothetical protein
LCWVSKLGSGVGHSDIYGQQKKPAPVFGGTMDQVRDSSDQPIQKKKTIALVSGILVQVNKSLEYQAKAS